MVEDMEEQELINGTDDFDTQEKQFCQAVTGMAVELRDISKSAKSTQVGLLTLTNAVLDKRKANPEVCTDRVYAFCMTWLAGAITFNRDVSWRLKSVVSFLAGAATVVVFNRFIG
jgi:hypothetical protein